MNKRLRRLNMAKRILKAHPDASADDVVGLVRAQEARRPETFKSIGELLEGFKCKKT